LLHINPTISAFRHQQCLPASGHGEAFEGSSPKFFVPTQILFSPEEFVLNTKNKNLALLKMYFVPQNLKPIYGPASLKTEQYNVKKRCIVT